MKGANASELEASTTVRFGYHLRGSPAQAPFPGGALRACEHCPALIAPKSAFTLASSVRAATSTRTLDLADGGWLSLVDGWLHSEEESCLQRSLLQDAPWKQESIKLFGKPVAQPRLTFAFADPGVSYRYSGLVIAPLPWTPMLLDIKQRVEREAKHSFNYVLANLYRDGADSMGFHADDEAELGKNPVIASVSLGGSRRFVLKHKRLSLPSVSLELTGGSLLVMAGTTQHHWLHGVPKTRRPVAPRINLTFHQIVS